VALFNVVAVGDNALSGCLPSTPRSVGFAATRRNATHAAATPAVAVAVAVAVATVVSVLSLPDRRPVYRKRPIPSLSP